MRIQLDMSDRQIDRLRVPGWKRTILRAMARYGAEGWSCREAEPGPGEEPVGGVFLKQHCEKTTVTRHLIVDRALYRRADQPLKDFVGTSELLILAPG